MKLFPLLLKIARTPDIKKSSFWVTILFLKSHLQNRPLVLRNLQSYLVKWRISFSACEAKALSVNTLQCSAELIG